MPTKITDGALKIIWYQDMDQTDQEAFKYNNPDNRVFGEEGWLLRCQKHAGCPLGNGHSGQCKNGDIQNRINRGPTDNKRYTAAVVKGFNLFRKKEPDFRGSEDKGEIEAIYDIEGDSEDASTTPTMTDENYEALDALLTKTIEHAASRCVFEHFQVIP